MSAFVVAAKEVDVVGVVDLQRKEVEDAFAAEVASVHIVAEEQVSGGCWVTTDLEELHEVKVLAVNIARH